MVTKALSLRQPWASLMLAGIKQIENRRWRTNHRGTVLVHVSQWWRQAEIDETVRLAERIMSEAGLGEMPFSLDDMKRIRGGIAGAFDITGCVSESDDPFFFGPHGFTVENAVAFQTTIPCSGSLGLFRVPPDVADQCKVLLGRQ